MLTVPLLALTLAAAPLHPMTVEDLLAFDRVSDPWLSPDGDQIAFTLSRPTPDGSGLTSAVWLVPAAGGEPRPLALLAERSSGARFSPDGHRLALLATRAGQGPRLLVVPLDGGEPVEAPAIPGRPAGHAWTPDGKALLVQAGSTSASTSRRTRRRPERPTPPSGCSSATGTSGGPAPAPTCCACRSTASRSPT